VDGAPDTVAVCATQARGATVTFTSPLQGSQAVGPLPIEVTTDATNIDRVEFYEAQQVGCIRLEQRHAVPFLA
jgi:hypothetical protein